MKFLNEMATQELLEYLEDFKKLERWHFYNRVKKELEKRNVKVGVNNERS